MSDLIDRQEVLDILKEKWNSFSCADDAMQESIDTIEDMPSVTPTQDCISRQAVHYYIESHINEIITESGVDKNEHTNRMLRALVNGVDTMPSVTPTEMKSYIDNCGNVFTYPTERSGHWFKQAEQI